MARSKGTVLLFGRTGSGKSTVANMLMKGDLNPPLVFQTSSGVRGKTVSFQKEVNAEYVIVDTVGFGEADRGSISDAEARNMLYDFFVKINEESYNYVAYIHKWGKLDELDARLWDFFKQAFAGGESNFVVIFTHCPRPQALEENMDDIRSFFSGCERFICVDFPVVAKVESSGGVKARRNEMVRKASLKRLFESLKGMMLPGGVLCLRSNMKKGRVLVMGSSPKARNMVAKMLVDGHTTILPRTWDDSSRDFEELEGRGWQVVNALALDPEQMGHLIDKGITWGVDGKAKRVELQNMFKSKVLGVMGHGIYNKFVYVVDCSEEVKPDYFGFDTITKVLQKFIGLDVDGRSWALQSCVVVIVNRNVVKKLVLDKFKAWGSVCEVQLPSLCYGSAIGREDVEEIQHQSLGILEGFVEATSCNIYPMAHELIEKVARKNLLSVLVEKFNTLDETKTTELVLIESTSCWCVRRPIFWSEHNQIVAELCDVRAIPHENFYVSIQLESAYAYCWSKLMEDLLWGELQIVDKHYVDKNIERLPLSTKRMEWDVPTHFNSPFTGGPGWKIGYGKDHFGRDFLTKVLEGDSIVVWMNPHIELLDYIDGPYVVVKVG